MKKIGITGNIASGKSEVEKILARMGYKIICADKIAHGLLENDKEVKTAVLALFSTLDRKKIGEIVFADPVQKEALEKIMHPKIIKKIEEFFVQNSSENLIFVSVALLYEINLKNMFDGVILVIADDKARLKRLMKRDDCSEKSAKLKMNSQMPQSEKIKLADFIIKNDSDINFLEKQVKSAVEYFL